MSICSFIYIWCVCVVLCCVVLCCVNFRGGFRIVRVVIQYAAFGKYDDGDGGIHVRTAFIFLSKLFFVLFCFVFSKCHAPLVELGLTLLLMVYNLNQEFSRILIYLHKIRV